MVLVTALCLRRRHASITEAHCSVQAFLKYHLNICVPQRKLVFMVSILHLLSHLFLQIPGLMFMS